MNFHVHSAAFTPVKKGDRLAFFKVAALHFEQEGTAIFKAAEGLEFLSLKAFKKEKLGQATIFTVMESLAQNHGLRTNGTFGGLTSAIGLDQQDAHKIGCACLGEIVMGQKVAERLHARIKELT